MWTSLPAKRPLMMGIINVTPDSFSGDGLMTHGDCVAAASEQAKRMIAEGADILDIGGESSRPGSTPVSVEEEMRRVVPVVKAIQAFLQERCAVAVDTVKAMVAEESLKAGASIINDISALQVDSSMASVVARYGAFVVLMDNRSRPEQTVLDATLGGRYVAEDDGDIVHAVLCHLEERVAVARAAGVAADKIILDPGLGFGKTVAQNLALVRELGVFTKAGYPVLIGPSRKSFIGQILNASVDDRLEGTAALVAVSAFLGADILRVHDVGVMAHVAHMAKACSTTP